jgi:two-component system alkaline phosphatase synthesis response regulator PhoP
VPRRVLVAEDEVKIAEVVKAYLEQAGFQVLLAHDGQEALAAFQQQKPDLVVLDLMLPGLHGLAVARAIRQKGTTPIIMLTAMADDVDRIVGLEVGADDYVTKPFNPRELVARVRAVLRRAEGTDTEEATVFISSVMRDYQAPRAAALEAIQELADAGFRVRAVTAEVQPAAPEPPRQALLQRVAESSLYLGILGQRYGYVNPQTGLAATHEEYRQARELGKPVLLFIERLPQGQEPETAQRAFIQEVQDYASGYYLKWFRNQEELKHETYRALERVLRHQP